MLFFSKSDEIDFKQNGLVPKGGNMKSVLKNVLAVTILGSTVPAHASLKAIEKEMTAFQAPLERALSEALQSDSRYSKYLSEISLAVREPNLKLRERKAIAVNLKYQPLFDDGMKIAKIDPSASQKKANSLMKKFSKAGNQYKIKAGPYLTWSAWLERMRQAEEPPRETEVTFQAPFSFEHSVEEGELLVRSDLETGRLSVISNRSFIGHHENRAGVGDFVRVPWNTGRIRVSARLPEVSGSVTAYAGPGGAGSKAFSVIDVLTEDQARCVEEFEHAITFAPVIWHSTVNFTDTAIMACEMAAPPAGQDIAVRFQVGADVTAGGMAFGLGSARGTPGPVRIRLIE